MQLIYKMVNTLLFVRQHCKYNVFVDELGKLNNVYLEKETLYTSIYIIFYPFNIFFLSP